MTYRVNKRIYFTILTVILFSLMLNSVLAETSFWGTLKKGDRMYWEWYETPETESVIVDIEVMELEGFVIKIRKGIDGSFTVHKLNMTSNPDKEIVVPFLIPASNLQSSQTACYSFKGNNYKVTYFSHINDIGDRGEMWRDYDTVILFEHRITTSMGQKITRCKLLSTNANLAENKCIGALLIFVIPLAVILSLTIIYYWIKRH